MLEPAPQSSRAGDGRRAGTGRPRSEDTVCRALACECARADPPIDKRLETSREDRGPWGAPRPTRWSPTIGHARASWALLHPRPDVGTPFRRPRRFWRL